MSIHKTEAIVLRRFDFRETSLIVNFFTRDFGKISGILKGIRVDPKKFASPCELFSHNEIIFYRKRNSALHLVSQADVRGHFNSNRQDLQKCAVASLMMELIAAVCAQEDKNEEIFDLALLCLKELETTYKPEKIATIFKIKALGLSGFQPHFTSCVSCAVTIPYQAKFSLGLGGLLCPKCVSKDASARSVFRGTIASILHIQNNTFTSTLTLGLNPQIKRELDQLLNAFIRFHLERELKSQKVLAAINDKEISYEDSYSGAGSNW